MLAFAPANDDDDYVAAKRFTMQFGNVRDFRSILYKSFDVFLAIPMISFGMLCACYVHADCA